MEVSSLINEIGFLALWSGVEGPKSRWETAAGGAAGRLAVQGPLQVSG